MITILVADDERAFLLSLAEGIKMYSNQFNILLASNGKRAIEILESEWVDLLITDLQMPEVDGFGLLSYLKKNEFDIPVLVMSAFGTPETEKRLREFEITRYMEKPLDYAELLQNILLALDPCIEENADDSRSRGPRTPTSQENIYEWQWNPIPSN